MAVVRQTVTSMWANEGVSAFYKGLTPRLLRVAPGNAVSFTVYEFVAGKLELFKANVSADEEAQLKKKDAEY